MHDDFEPIARIVERLVIGMASVGEEPTDATARSRTGGTRRAHTTPSEGVGGDVVIWVNFAAAGATQPEGPTWPPRQHFTKTVFPGAPGRQRR